MAGRCSIRNVQYSCVTCGTSWSPRNKTRCTITQSGSWRITGLGWSKPAWSGSLPNVPKRSWPWIEITLQKITKCSWTVSKNWWQRPLTKESKPRISKNIWKINVNHIQIFMYECNFFLYPHTELLYILLILWRNMSFKWWFFYMYTCVWYIPESLRMRLLSLL